MTIVDDTAERGAVFPPEQLLHTPEEAAQALGIGRTTVFALIKEGALRAVHIGRSCRISRAELVRYVTALDAEAAERAAVLTAPRAVRPYHRRSA